MANNLGWALRKYNLGSMVLPMIINFASEPPRSSTLLTNLIGSKPCSPIAKPPKRFNISAAYIQLQYYHFQYGFMVFHDLVKSYVGLSRATASERLFLTQLDFDEILFEAIIRKTKNCSFAIGTLILQQPISKYLQYAHCRIICEWNMLWFN